MGSTIWIAYVIALGTFGLWTVLAGLRAGCATPAGRARVILGLGITLLVAKRFMVEDSLPQELAELVAPLLMIWGFVLSPHVGLANGLKSPAATARADGSGGTPLR